MITVKPFKALRPKKELYSAIPSLPYDVLSVEEMKKEAGLNPQTFYRIIRADIEFDSGIDPYSDMVYEKAKNNFIDFVNKGYLIQDSSECFYAYRLSTGAGRSQTGLICLVSVKDYENGIIRPHEKTRVDKVNDRIRYIETLKAHTGFVFLAFRKNKELNDIIANVKNFQPEINFTTRDSINHTLWKINDNNKINEVIEAFKKTSLLYIADGHHRANASYIYAKNNNCLDNKSPGGYMLAVIFPDTELSILPYNRAVKDLNGCSMEDFLKRIEENFKVQKVKSNDSTIGYKPLKNKQIGMYLNNNWYLLLPDEKLLKINDPILSLDVSLLQDYILQPILGINDPRTDKRIDFIGGNRDSSVLKKIVDSKEYAVSFSMHPTSIEQLMNVADVNKLMPPKSTWFEPKPRSGITIYKFG